MKHTSGVNIIDGISNSSNDLHNEGGNSGQKNGSGKGAAGNIPERTSLLEYMEEMNMD